MEFSPHRLDLRPPLTTQSRRPSGERRTNIASDSPRGRRFKTNALEEKSLLVVASALFAADDLDRGASANTGSAGFNHLQARLLVTNATGSLRPHEGTDGLSNKTYVMDRGASRAKPRRRLDKVSPGPLSRLGSPESLHHPRAEPFQKSF